MPELLDEAAIAELEKLEGELLADLAALYFDQAAGIMSDLGLALSRGDVSAICHGAHKLTGSSKTLGATLVGNLASQLEGAGAAGDLEVAGDLFGRVRSALDETEKTLLDREANR
jgi:HPt (histidine-containing phosphotransfer) domain-containing protein